MTSLLDRLRRRTPGVSPDLPSGSRLPDLPPSSFEEEDPFASTADADRPGRSTYDPSQRELLEPQLGAMGLELPEDPDSAEFRELIARVRSENPALSVAVQGMVRGDTLREDNEILASAGRRARRAGALSERLRQLFMTLNANGEPVLDKNAGMIAAGATGLLLFAGIALYSPGSGRASAPTRNAVGATIDRVPGPDGSATSTSLSGTPLSRRSDEARTTKTAGGEAGIQTPDGVLTTRSPDGHSMVKAADGTSLETLADGSTVSRDAAGKVVGTTPPLTVAAGGGSGLTGSTLPDTGTVQTQPAAPLDTDYQSTPPAATDPNVPRSAPIARQLPAQTAAASSGSPASDAFAGIPSPEGTSNPAPVEPAAPDTPVGPTPTMTSGEGRPTLLTPAAGAALSVPETAAGPGTTGRTTPPGASGVHLTVYRMGHQQGTQQADPAAAGGTPGADQVGVVPPGGAQDVLEGPTGSRGGQPRAVAFRRTPVISIQVLRAAPTAGPSDRPADQATAASTGQQEVGNPARMVAFKKSTVGALTTRVSRTTAPGGNASAAPVPGEEAAPPGPLDPVNPPGPGSDAGTATAGPFVAPSVPVATAPSPYRLGQRILATLQTGVYVAQGSGSLPVYASTPDGTLWRGTVSLDRTKRVQLIFDRAVLQGGTEVEVQAAAYNLDGTPGLKAQYRDIAPTLANDLIRSAVSGVREYVDARLQATTATSAGGAVTVERQVPSIGESVAGSAAGIFQLPEAQNTFVTVAQIPVGAPFALVYGPTKTEQATTP